MYLILGLLYLILDESLTFLSIPPPFSANLIFLRPGSLLAAFS